MIRPYRHGDYLAWMKMRHESREFLQPWEPTWQKDALTRAAWRRMMTRITHEWREDYTYSFLIFLRDTDQLIGGINLNRVVRGVADRAQLGYWIGSAYARQGYMSEALRLAVQFGFGEQHLHRLEAAFIPRNLASRAVLRRLGFVEEGLVRSYLRINGTWEDHILSSLIIDDLV